MLSSHPFLLFLPRRRCTVTLLGDETVMARWGSDSTKYQQYSIHSLRPIPFIISQCHSAASDFVALAAAIVSSVGAIYTLAFRLTSPIVYHTRCCRRLARWDIHSPVVYRGIRPVDYSTAHSKVCACGLGLYPYRRTILFISNVPPSLDGVSRVGSLTTLIVQPWISLGLFDNTDGLTSHMDEWTFRQPSEVHHPNHAPGSHECHWDTVSSFPPLEGHHQPARRPRKPERFRHPCRVRE